MRMRSFIQKHFTQSEYRICKAASQYRNIKDSELARIVEIENYVKNGLKIFFFVFGFIFAFIGMKNINLLMIAIAGLSEFIYIGLMLWRKSLASIEYRRRLKKKALVRSYALKNKEMFIYKQSL